MVIEVSEFDSTRVSNYSGLVLSLVNGYMIMIKQYFLQRKKERKKES